MRKSSTLAAIVMGLATLAIAGCSAEPEAPASTAPDAPEGISVSGGVLTLPAVAGNPGAAYFTISNTGPEVKIIRTAEVLGAGSAVIHQTTEWDSPHDMQEASQVAVPAGGQTVFEPGGLHVMVMDIDDSLAVGAQTEVTLTFPGGDKVSFPVQIRPAGDPGVAQGG